MPEAITTTKSTVARITQLFGVLEEEGVQALQRSDCFQPFTKSLFHVFQPMTQLVFQAR